LDLDAARPLNQDKKEGTGMEWEKGGAVVENNIKNTKN